MKKLKVVFKLVLLIAVLGVIFGLIDAKRAKNNQLPLFAIKLNQAKNHDGEIVDKYYGLGYKVIDCQNNFSQAINFGLYFHDWSCLTSYISEGIETDTIIEWYGDYNVHATYPILQDESFNETVKDRVAQEIDSFKSNIVVSDSKAELNISYELIKSESLYSFHFIVYKFSGMANPAYVEYVYYYDIKNNKEVKYDALFKDQTKALKKLSDLSSKELKSRKNLVLYDDEEVAKGLEPTEENFSLLLFTDDKLKVVFPLYQVAPRSTGRIELEFDEKEFADLLNYQGKTNETPEKDSSVDSATTLLDEARKTRDIETLKGKQVMMITFDDGPAGSTTTRLLDELEKKDARVTFFALGSRVVMYPDIIKRAYREGHTVASHTYDHKDLKNLSDAAVLEEINKTNALLTETIGITNQFVRPPYGSINAHITGLTKMTFINWSVDPEDWKYKNAATVHQNIMNHAQDGAISLTHDLYVTSVDGALAAIDDLLSQGYAVISLEEAVLLGYVNPEVKRVYFSLK